jgi:hypothetical protein
MDKLLLEKVGKTGAGYNALLKLGAAGMEGGKFKIFADHIEFKLLWFSKCVNISDIDFIEIRINYTFWFAHHGKTWRFLSFSCQPKDKEDIVNTLKSLNIKIKEEISPKIKLSPY